jgi:hypothetical protein
MVNSVHASPPRHGLFRVLLPHAKPPRNGRPHGSPLRQASMLRLQARRICSSAQLPKLLFSPFDHLWVSLQRDAAVGGGLTSPRAAWKLHVGVTKRGFDEIGTMTGLEALAKPGAPIAVGEPLLRILWEGHKISDGDELYHTTWENTEGEFVVNSPVAGTLVELHQGASDTPTWTSSLDVDAADWLAVLHVDRPALQSAQLVDAAAYDTHVRSLGPGTFSEEGLYD